MKEENKRAGRIFDTATAEPAGSVPENSERFNHFSEPRSVSNDDSAVIPCISCSYYTYYGCTKTGSCRLLASWQELNGNIRVDTAEY